MKIQELFEGAEKSGRIYGILSMRSSFFVDAGPRSKRTFAAAIDSYVWGSGKMSESELRTALNDLDMDQLKELENELRLIMKNV